MRMDTPPSKKLIFSTERKPSAAPLLPVLRSDAVKINDFNVADGRFLLSCINNEVITAAFFDPQYRGVMDKLNYGNEGESRQTGRAALSQMDDSMILEFIREIDRTLVKSGHLFLWIDKFHLCEGTSHWFNGTTLQAVDLITWDKGRIGMGYRTRRKSEYLLVLQKQPLRAKNVWTRRDIPDVWTEKITGKIHPHQKPVLLQQSLIEAVSTEEDVILDPCSGSYSVFNACQTLKRNFIGGDVRIHSER